MNPKTKTLIVLLLSFFLGCVVGASLLSGLWRDLVRPERQWDNYRTYMYERLQLDTLQRVQLDSLLDVYRSTMDSYRQTLDSSRGTLRMEIKGLLSDEQRMEYDMMIAEMTKRERHKRPDSLRTN